MPIYQSDFSMNRNAIPLTFALVILLSAGMSGSVRAAETSVVKAKELLARAQAAYSSGKTEEATALATKAVEADPTNPEGFYVRGRLEEASRRYDKAIADYSKVLEIDSTATGLYQRRGEARFKFGQINESIADFDKFIQLAPQQKPHHWQRGISCYYAGRYEDGRLQFELHQTVNSNDVENAVWHFLCVAKKSGLEKARASLIRIKEDRRVPMMQVYALYAGKGTVDAVLDAARAGHPAAAELNRRLFYAQLYLGLYYDAQGDTKTARGHIARAAENYEAGSYMGDVARVHLKLMDQAGKK